MSESASSSLFSSQRMLRMGVYVWLLFLRASISACAYVQIKDCFNALANSENGNTQPWFEYDGLRVALCQGEDATFLQLNLGVISDSVPCEGFETWNISTGLTMSTLGGHHRYTSNSMNTSCSHPTSSLLSSHINTRLHAKYQIDQLHLLDTFDLIVDLRGPEGQLVGCVNAPLTPDIGPAVSQLALWGPIGVFIVVVGVALLHELANVALVAEVQEDGDGQTPSRGHLTRIADCLSYIQFIFFSAALSLRYPGFLQPVACRSSWATLMLPAAPVVRTTLYEGVKDGIYEVNGTFGGTPGLELMTQIMGAPVTTGTWTNIMSLSLMVLALLILIVQLGQRLELTRDWFTATGRLTLNVRRAHSLKLTFWVVLRLFISYLLLPLVAWTTYQLDHAAFSPIFYTTLTTLVLCLVMLSFWWGLRQTGPAELGYLILDKPGRGLEQEPRHTPRLQNVYATVTFLLLFVRGAAIGGLQVMGQAQLFILIACEAIQVIMLAWMLYSSLVPARTFITAGAKLAVLLLCIGLLPGVAGLETRIALGYSILPIHAVVLVAVFLIPSVWDAVRLSKTLFPESESHPATHHEAVPQIYNLRQLKRRPNASTNLSIHSQQDLQSFILNSPQAPPSSTPSPTIPISPRETSLDKPLSYFRQPRQRESSRMLTPSQQDLSQFNARHSPSSSDVSSHARSSDESDTSEAGCADSTAYLRSSASPNVDYSFREADLYYGPPRRLSFGQGPASATPSRASSILDRLTMALGSHPKSPASE